MRALALLALYASPTATFLVRIALGRHQTPARRP